MNLPNLSPRLEAMRGESSFKVLSRANELEAQGKSVIHLEIGQPDFPTPEPIVEAAIKALKDGKTKYNPSRGLPDLREMIAQHLSVVRGINVSSDMVAVTPSGKTAMFLALASVLEPGDEVIYPDPGFPTYEDLIFFFGAIPKPIPLVEENQFSFDLEALRKSITPKTKVLILNSPSNPTGGVMSKKDLEAVYFIIQDHNFWVLSDEIYAHILYDGLTQLPSLAHFPGMLERTFIVDGFSKTYSMTGWRLGFLIFPKRFTSLIDKLVVNAVGCTATFTQYAGLAALKTDDVFLRNMVGEFEKRRNFIIDALNQIAGVTCQKPQGAFYAFPSVKSFGISSNEIAKHLLDEAGLALLSGTFYGKHGEGYLRLSYATSMENLKEGVKRLSSGLQSLKS